MAIYAQIKLFLDEVSQPDDPANNVLFESQNMTTEQFLEAVKKHTWLSAKRASVGFAK